MTLVNNSLAIRLNSLGFLPPQKKLATIALPCTVFSVLKENGDNIFSGSVSGPFNSSDTGEVVFIADFSAVTVPGFYCLSVDNVGVSILFQIGANIYSKPFRTAMLGMYLWRCGTAVSAFYDGFKFSHDACHCDDAWLDYIGGGHLIKKSTGGWHDAGDYNKYVVNAGITVFLMCKAWEQFKEWITDCEHLVDGDGALPHYLQEIKWEIDWLFTMQMDSGAVSHKISAKRFCSFVMPEQETEPRYFTDWSSTATADFVAMLAMASRNFQPYDIDYANLCLSAALKSYGFLHANPHQYNPGLTEFKTGEYSADDQVHRLWASAEMWETSGNESYLKDFEQRIVSFDSFIDLDFNWRDVKNLGVITYFNSKRIGRNPELVGKIRKEIISTADLMAANCQQHAYGRSLGGNYCWGGNSNLLNTVLILNTAYDLTGNMVYRDTALEAIGFIFGRNRYCRSFVTGIGFNPPLHPHDRRSGGDNVDPPWPGYLVGGPNKSANDYQDCESDCFTNEIAVNWNAALIYALSGFVDFR